MGWLKRIVTMLLLLPEQSAEALATVTAAGPVMVKSLPSGAIELHCNFLGKYNFSSSGAQPMVPMLSAKIACGTTCRNGPDSPCAMACPQLSSNVLLSLPLLMIR